MNRYPGFFKLICIGLALFNLTLGVQTGWCDNPDITQAGNILQFVLPGLALGSTFFAGNPEGGLWDREGTKQAAYSMATSAAFVISGKEIARKLRPDGSDRNSFPSGHTAAAFSGASFLGTRYGMAFGVPAYAAAALVGYSRYQADQHYADDVLAGASIAMLSNWAWVTPMHDRFTLSPIAVEGGAGIQVAFTDAKPAAKTSTPAASIGFPNTRFSFQFGPSFVTENEIGGQLSTDFDLTELEDNDNPLTTAAVRLDHHVNENHEIGLFIWPMEAKDSGTLSHPVLFQGVSFPANTRILSAWRLYDVRARYRYHFFPRDWFVLAGGGGVMLQHHIVRLETEDLKQKAEEDDLSAVPFLHIQTGYRFNEHIGFYIEEDGGWLSNQWFSSSTAYLQYNRGTHWDIRLGYQYTIRDIDANQVDNRVVQHQPYLVIGYRW